MRRFLAPILFMGGTALCSIVIYLYAPASPSEDMEEQNKMIDMHTVTMNVLHKLTIANEKEDVEKVRHICNGIPFTNGNAWFRCAADVVVGKEKTFIEWVVIRYFNNKHDAKDGAHWLLEGYYSRQLNSFHFSLPESDNQSGSEFEEQELDIHSPGGVYTSGVFFDKIQPE